MNKFTLDNGSTTITAFLKRHLDIRSKSGLEWLAVCPFHQDTNPSMSVNIRKGVYICYACGAKGNTKTLARHFQEGEPTLQETNIDDVSLAVKELADSMAAVYRPNIGIKYASRFCDNPSVDAYWNGVRKLSREQIKNFALGFDTIENEAIIPVHDKRMNVLGLVKRTIDENKIREGYPKYRYPKGMKISQCLFGLPQAEAAFGEAGFSAHTTGVDIHSVLVICEGAVDAISVSVGKHSRSDGNGKGFQKTTHYSIAGVAVLGARMSTHQAEAVRYLAPRSIVIATDQDRAGRMAAIQVRKAIEEMRTGSFIYDAVWDRGLGKDMAELPYSTRMNIISSLL